jgi:hypothetical protein
MPPKGNAKSKAPAAQQSAAAAAVSISGQASQQQQDQSGTGSATTGLDTQQGDETNSQPPHNSPPGPTINFGDVSLTLDQFREELQGNQDPAQLIFELLRCAQVAAAAGRRNDPLGPDSSASHHAPNWTRPEDQLLESTEKLADDDPEPSGDDSDSSGDSRPRSSSRHRHRSSRRRSRSRSRHRSCRHKHSRRPKQELKPLGEIKKLLTDGISPSYAGWELLVRNKLERDHAQYPTLQNKLLFILSCTDGKAFEILTPRLERNSRHPITSVDEAFTILENGLADRHRRSKAEAQLAKLEFHENDDWHTFFAEFTRLLIEADVNPTEYKRYLAERLPEVISLQVGRYENDEDCDYERFRQEVAFVALQLEKSRLKKAIKRAAAREHERAPRSQAPTPARRPSGTPKPASRRQTPTPRASTQPPAAPKRGSTPPDGPRCYTCNGVGHFAKDCPNPRIAAMNAAATAEEEDDHHDAQEVEEEDPTDFDQEN